MNTREGQCYTCYDSTMFQLFGQTDKYLSVNHSEVYIENYQKGLKESAVVECVTCCRKVEYQKLDSGKWKEVEVKFNTI